MLSFSLLFIIIMLARDVWCYSPHQITNRGAFVKGAFITGVLVPQFLLHGESVRYSEDESAKMIEDGHSQSTNGEDGLQALFSRRHSWLKRRLERELLAAQRKAEATEKRIDEMTLVRFAEQE
mmetsp:Transcript_7596/g.9474  ORF Transcript_7596/g.9474 Transcript_7596/m.9474 type:complete len:123 (+) Transcript_7596:68-436(+)